MSYGQIRSQNRDNSCKSGVMTVKETYRNQKCFSVLSHWKSSFLDLQELGEVDSRGMALDVLFS